MTTLLAIIGAAAIIALLIAKAISGEDYKEN